ncbi:hypothetical protein ACOSP7_012397 [Xanthoceras sorbifolium]
MVGLGVVIRDSKGLVMLSSSRNLDACYSPNIAEAKAILFGMQLAIDSGLLPAVVESDSSSVISLINAKNSIFTDIGSILADIFDLRDSYPLGSFLLLGT